MWGGSGGRGIKQFKVILGYIASVNPTWDTEESVSKQIDKQQMKRTPPTKSKHTIKQNKTKPKTKRDTVKKKKKEKRRSCIN